MNLLEKKAVTFDQLEAQSAFELPNREMLALVTIIFNNLLNNNDVDVNIPIEVKNNNIAVQVCAVVQALNVALLGPPGGPAAGATIACAVGQQQ